LSIKGKKIIMGEPSLATLTAFLQEARRRYTFVTSDIEPDAPHRIPDSIQESGEENAATDWAQSPPAYRQFSPTIEAAWCRAAQVFYEGQIVTGIVTGWNRGGLLVRWDELQGFVPASQLRDVPLFDADDARDETLARWVGEELALKVIELDRSRNRLVFSERATVWGPKDGERLLSEVKAGEIRRGHISNLCDFGAFVDLGGVDGLVHVSELAWGRVTHPREMLAIGQEVEAYVISVDKDNRRIALSLKRLRPDPWTVVGEKYHIGQILHVTITNIVDFGAFARIEDGLEGLIHVSELTDETVTHPGEVVSMGEEVEVRILRIDSINHRLGLSIRQAATPSTGDESFGDDLRTRVELREPPTEIDWNASARSLY
jgi:small subunit ribosomal protein S1